MSNPFDYVNSIGYTKENLMRDTDNDELAEKDYVPFVTNRNFSNFIDTIYLANEMNTRSELDNKLQYEFFINIIRPKRRYAKWAKPDQNDDIDLLKEYYGYNTKKAEEALSLLSADQLGEIKRFSNKGGRQ
tara:strand:- start:138 stop:530 length:393 start_codon:yes stop_codon:yes gene_type:complete